MASAPEQIRHLVDRALRIAKVERTVTCLIIPNDVQELAAVPDPPRAHGTVHSSAGVCEPYVVPQDDDLRRAADILNAGSRVAMLIGAGALGASDQVLEVAEVLGAGIAKALLGKAAVPDDLPFVTGAIGLLGTKPSWDLMMECDTLLMVGTNFPYSEFLPRPGQARGIQIDIDGRMLGIRFPTELNLIGDAAETLRVLLPYLERKSDRGWRDTIEAEVAEWWRVLEARAMNDANPINPQRIFWELSSRLPDNCILSSDSGSSANCDIDLEYAVHVLRAATRARAARNDPRDSARRRRCRSGARGLPPSWRADLRPRRRHEPGGTVLQRSRVLRFLATARSAWHSIPPSTPPPARPPPPLNRHRTRQSANPGHSATRRGPRARNRSTRCP